MCWIDLDSTEEKSKGSCFFPNPFFCGLFVDGCGLARFSVVFINLGNFVPSFPPDGQDPPGAVIYDGGPILDATVSLIPSEQIIQVGEIPEISEFPQPTDNFAIKTMTFMGTAGGKGQFFPNQSLSTFFDGEPIVVDSWSDGSIAVVPVPPAVSPVARLRSGWAFRHAQENEEVVRFTHSNLKAS